MEQITLFRESLNNRPTCRRVKLCEPVVAYAHALTNPILTPRLGGDQMQILADTHTLQKNLPSAANRFQKRTVGHHGTQLLRANRNIR